MQKTIILYTLRYAVLATLCCIPLAAEHIITKGSGGERSKDTVPNEESALIIDEKAIEKSGALSLAQLLSSEGFFVTQGASGGQSRVTISGLTAQNIHVYIDGVLQNTSTNGTFDWNTVDLSQVECIKVYRDGYCPLLEVAAFSGAVIWIETRSPSLPCTVIDGSTLFYDTRMPDTEEISVTCTGKKRVDPERPVSSRHRRRIEPYREAVYRGEVPECREAAYRGAEKTTSRVKEISYKASAALKHAGNEYCDMENADCSLSSAAASLAMLFERSTLALDLHLTNSDVNVPPESGQAGEEKDSSLSVNVEGDTVFCCFDTPHRATEQPSGFVQGSNASNSKVSKIGDWRVKYGGGYRHTLTKYESKADILTQDDIADKEKDTHRLDTLSFNAAVLTPKLGIFSAYLSATQYIDIMHSTAADEHTRWSGFIKLLTTYQLFPIMAVDAGFTLDGYGEDVALNPICALRFSYGIFNAVASYARLYQCPTMEQLYWSSGVIKGNRNLKSEAGDAFSFTLSSTLPYCPFSASVSYIDYRDKIRYMDNTFKNISNANIWKSEIRAEPQVRVKSALFALHLAYIFTSAKIDGGVQDKNQIMDVPMHTFSAALTCKVKGLLLGVNGEYVSKRYVSNWNAMYNGQYFELGAFAHLNIPIRTGTTLCPYLKAGNLLDNRVYSDYTRTIYQPSRSIVCGVKIKM